MLTEKERTAKLIKPILRGKDIKRYSYEWAGLWLINTHNGYEISTCHSKGARRSEESQIQLCHSERSEESTADKKCVNLKVDSSFATQTQNDKIAELEQEIDNLVYALYDLNESEIELIEKV